MSQLRDYYESGNFEWDDIDERQLQELMDRAEQEAENDSDENLDVGDEETV